MGAYRRRNRVGFRLLNCIRVHLRTRLLPHPGRGKERPVAKEFLKWLIQAKVCNEYLKTGLARHASIVKGDPWWPDAADPHRVAYVKQPLLGSSVPNFWVCNPAYAQVQNEHVWSVGWVDIMKEGVAHRPPRIRRSSGSKESSRSIRLRRPDGAAGARRSRRGLAREHR